MHSAYVKDPEEMRMGSPHYGRLVLDSEEFPTADDIESLSLRWSDDGRLLAAQELVSWSVEPETRVVVIDADRRVQVAASPPHLGLCNPRRFEDDALVYRRWHYREGEADLRLLLPPRTE